MSAPPSGPGGTSGPGSRVEVVSLLAAAAATALALMLPRPDGLSVEGQRAAALFAGVLILWGTEALPLGVTSMLFLVLQALFTLTTLAAAPRPPTTGNILGAAIVNFMSPPFFFVLVMFIIAFAWVKTGLARRFALWMISLAGTDARRAVYVFMFGTGLISTIVSDVPSAAIFMAIAVGILDRLGLRPGSQFGRAVMLGIPIASLIGGVATPAGSSINLLGVPMVVVLLPVAAWVLVRFYPPEIATIGRIEDITKERSELGPISASEWKVVAVMSAMFVLWVASTWVPAIDVYLVSIAGACAMFLPGIKLFTWREAQHATAWDTLMMIGGVTSLGTASSRTGLAEWLAGAVLGGLQAWPPAMLIAAISAFTVVIHLALPINPVINAVMIPPLMVLGKAAGVNPALYALPVVFTASCAFLLPLDAVPLVTYSRGYYRMIDMAAPGAVISLIWVILMTGLLLLVGPLVG